MLSPKQLAPLRKNEAILNRFGRQDRHSRHSDK